MENTKSKDPTGQGVKVCEPCDDCYNLVSEAANRHRANLEALDAMLKQIAENPEPVGPDFQYDLRQLHVKVTAAFADARISSQNADGGTLRDRLEDLRVKLEAVTNLVTESDGKIEIAKGHGEEANKNYKKAKQIIDNARESLKEAQKLLNNQGREALKKATDRAKKFGKESAQMSSIAREARTFAERQEEYANEIASIAQQAYKTAKEADEMTTDALEQQIATSKQIRVLNVQVNDMGDKLMKVQSLASKTLRDSTDAYNQALHIYRQAIGLEVPEVNSSDLKDQADKIEAEAVRIRKEAQRLIDENRGLIQETQDRRVQLEDLLLRAETQQQQVDAQLADMDSNRAKALKAVEDGNNVLNDAAKTLNTLEDFENSVNDNRQAALDALQNTGEIEEMVRTALLKATEAKEAMAGADTSANLALTVAEDAQSISSQASEAASQISQEASQNRGLADELASAAESLTVKIESTKRRLDDKEVTAESDGADALRALEKANKAQHKARASSKKVIEAQKELDEIATILSTVEEPGKS